MNKLVPFAAAAFAALAVFSSTVDYAKKPTRTVNPAATGYGAADVADVPVAVRLSESISGFSYSDFQVSDGGDLLFTDESGNALAHEIERWDENGESVVWVKMPAFGAGRKLYAYYGGAANAQNAATASSQITARLAPVADMVRASYENSLAWYLMGLFFTKENDVSNAEIAFREAGRICPAITPLAVAPAGGGQDVIVVYEENLIDMREPIKIPLPFGGTVWSVDFPIYSAPACPPSPIAVEVGGAVAASCIPVVNVQALAYRDLKDRVPGIATRNVTRAAVKIAAQQVANHVNTGNSYADLAIMLGVFAYNLTSTVITEADTRAWQTVPEHVHLGRFALPAGKNSITVRNARTGRACEIAVSPGGGTKIVWISDVRGFATATVLSVGAKGTSSWARIPSLL